MNPKKILSEGPYINKNIKRQLDKAKEIVTKSDQDRVYVIDGREGLGKSTLAMQLAYYFDPTVTLDNVIFGAKQFEQSIRSFSKNKALIWDEAFKGLSSKGSLTKENKRIVTLLQECRQLNLFIFIVLPSFFLLEKYAAIFRSHGLFHVMASRKNIKLRYFKVYNYKNKKLLYIYGKNLMSYYKPKIIKSYKFYGKLPPTIDKNRYIQKKLLAFRSYSDDKPEETKHLKQRHVLSALLKEKFNFGYSKQSDWLKKFGVGVDTANLSRGSRDISQKLRFA